MNQEELTKNLEFFKHFRDRVVREDIPLCKELSIEKLNLLIDILENETRKENIK